MRFPILFDSWYRVLSQVLLLSPSRSFVDVMNDAVECRMGWGFRARFPVSAVERAERVSERPLSRGVHGFAGRWLVNGSADGLVAIDLAPAQTARVLGVPVRLTRLLVSVAEPDALIARLA
jgi:hypothetical protein